MKKLFTIIAVALLTSCPDNTMAQSISVDITSGGLEKALGGENNYTALTIQGSIDVRDFAYINQYIDGLVSIDLSQCEITGYDSREEQYFGYRSHFEANEIPPASFFGFTSLESVKLPESTTAINDGAFAGCSKLNQITWPAAIETIGDYAFNSCDALGSPIFPASLRTIGDYAFNKCSSIEELDFTNCTRLTKIGACAFSLDTSLTTIQLPASITYLGDGALAGCYNLKNVNMQPCTLQMGDAVFAQCHSLQQIDLSQTWLQRLPAWSFSGCKILASAILPASLTHIEEGAFYYCEALTTASLPAGITTLADFAFAGCKGLDSITFMEEGLEQIGRYSFSDFAGDFELKNLPQLCEIKIGDLASRSCNFSNGSFVIKGLEWFGMRQFVDLPHLRSIQLGFQAFNQPLTTVLESIQYGNCRAIHRSASITIDYPRRLFSCWNTEQFLLFVNHEGYKEETK